MIVYIYNIGVDLYNGFNGLRHRINWTYYTVLDGLAHPLYSLVTENDLFYVCYMIEKTSRFLHQRNQYVVNQLGYDHLYHLISVANVLHSDNRDKVVHDLMDEYKLEYGSFHVENVNSELCSHIPTELEMGKVYAD